MDHYESPVETPTAITTQRDDSNKRAPCHPMLLVHQSPYKMMRLEVDPLQHGVHNVAPGETKTCMSHKNIFMEFWHVTPSHTIYVACLQNYVTLFIIIRCLLYSCLLVLVSDKRVLLLCLEYPAWCKYSSRETMFPSHLQCLYICT